MLPNTHASRLNAARAAAFGICALASLVLGGCETLYMQPRAFSKMVTAPGALQAEATVEEPDPTTTLSVEDASEPAKVEMYQPGTEQFVRAPPARRADPDAAAGSPGEITLNFENTSILEVVKVILGDLLQQNYRIGAGVQGTVTLQTSKPIRRSALLATLEMLLRSNNAALVHGDGIYHVVQRDAAIQGMLTPQLGDSSLDMPRGYSVRLVPLRYIGAQEMHKILEPFTTAGNVVRVDTPRNLLVLAGAQTEMRRLLETIEVFDVDWLKGMSVAMFKPDFVDAKTLAQELRSILDTDAGGPLTGLVRIVELERLNALLVVTPRKVYLQRIADWIAQLDKESGGVGQRLFVYHVQNGRAAELAGVLSQVFEEDESARPVPSAEIAPGLQAVELASRAEPGQTATQPSGTASAGTTAAPGQPATPAGVPTTVGRRSSGADEGLTISADSSVRIIADEVNNALLIKATAQEYKLVEAALKRLDIVPLQVLVEATIAEITLTDELEFGLEWFFKNQHGNNKIGTAILDGSIGSPGRGGTIIPGAAGFVAPLGFSYAITDAAGIVRAALNMLATESRVNILSSPSLMVLNNQTATINVGDEVPVTTQQQQATTGASTIVNSIEFRDTGVLLTVTPRVNAGGLVTMELEQEVSNVAPGTGGSLTPTIQQRKINSTVAIASGATVVLGGLIRENTTFAKAGIPVLHTLPLFGPLFGSTDQDQRRTELVILITPRVVQDATSARQITEEFKEKMDSLKPPPPVPLAGTKVTQP